MKSLIVLLAISCSAIAQDAAALIASGDALDARNKNSEALAIYLQAGALTPNDAEILRRISKQYAQLMLDAPGDTRKRELGSHALDAAQRAVKLDPGNANAHLALAIVYGRIAFTESARRKVEISKLIRDSAETATRLDPQNDLAWHVLGRWNYELASFNPFLKALAQAIYGKFPDASIEKAVEYLAKAESLNSRSVIHPIELGRAYAALGRKEEARREIQKGLSLPSTAKDDDETKARGRKTLKELGT